jgi:hypothetical protein
LLENKSEADKKGSEYTMYILTMSRLPQGHYLISDRYGTPQNLPRGKTPQRISLTAQKLWSRLHDDPDKYKKPIDNKDRPLTPETFDDGDT